MKVCETAFFSDKRPINGQLALRWMSGMSDHETARLEPFGEGMRFLSNSAKAPKRRRELTPTGSLNRQDQREGTGRACTISRLGHQSSVQIAILSRSHRRSSSRQGAAQGGSGLDRQERDIPASHDQMAGGKALTYCIAMPWR
jgi:hypothetical protein